MRILAFETSTQLGGVALVAGDARETAGPFAPRESSRQVLAAAHALLARHGLAPRDLDVVAASTGPGLFTGVRVGLSIAKTIAWARGAERPAALVGVPTLQAVASLALGEDGECAAPGDPIAALTDARRGEVYAALFRAQGPADSSCAAADAEEPRRLCEDLVVRPDCLAQRLASAAAEPIDYENARLWLVGDAMDLYGEIIRAQFGGPVATLPLRPGALALRVADLGLRAFLAGRTSSPEALRPQYVRRPDARVPAARFLAPTD